MINRTTFLLSPLALGIIFFYSLTKRFTAASHFFLGLALAVAPAGAWIAATGQLALAPLLLGAGVVGWVAGFDLIYATQDFEFDQREGLHSLVVRLGIARAMRLAQLLHFAMFLALARLRIRRRAGPNLLLRDAARRRRAGLRTPECGPTRSRRNQSSVFPEQRFRQRGLSYLRLGGGGLTIACRLELGNSRDVAAALEIGRQPDAHDPQGQVLRDHALA